MQEEERCCECDATPARKVACGECGEEKEGSLCWTCFYENHWDEWSQCSLCGSTVHVACSTTCSCDGEMSSGICDNRICLACYSEYCKCSEESCQTVLGVYCNGSFGGGDGCRYCCEPYCQDHLSSHQLYGLH